ncbi:ubiquitin carboxyl-terminal hydrolase 16-like isoform X2 [Varroa jacobsoni]|uniref:ubiquitin carboxyl-terminal hydrolase 16-like isoform X2 n=1 Tax=Varroa jacobsoni TaxID=62625 RepID=UPI000BF8CB7A|nr:ubiquitin carboxyl-terminal hydrolase 16-like isoform X2 [Varroa jacobsoni]
MVKKNRRHSDQDTRGVEERPPELEIAPKCPHLGKALCINRLRKAWTSGELGDLSACKQCEKEQDGREKEVEEIKENKVDSDNKENGPTTAITSITSTIASMTDENAADAIWICLQCANRGCSRYSKNQHAVKHQNASYSDSHDIAVNCVTWQVWCYKCNEYLNPQQTESLDQAIKGLQSTKSKQLEGYKTGQPPQECSNKKRNNLKDFRRVATVKTESNSKRDKSTFDASLPSPSSEESTPLSDVNVKVTLSDTEELQRPKGLQNLGNTCFFNSVMQNLAQTHLLTDACIAAARNSPGGVLWTVQPMGKKSVIRDMKTLELKLHEAGELTSALADFFHFFRNRSSQLTLCPSDLFGHICQKSPQFRGFAQQDSHELLRHLFDGVFSEESKRMKRTILSHFGLKKNVNPDSVKPYLRTQIDAYKKQTHHTFLETIFGGLLINTILCLKCRKSSQNFEPFVDISLSIATPRPVKMPAPAQRKPDPIMDELEEKYGTKKGASLNKLKLNNKKAKKKRRQQQNMTKNEAQDASRSRENSPAIVNDGETASVKEDSAGSTAEDDLDSSVNNSMCKLKEQKLNEGRTVATATLKETAQTNQPNEEVDGEKDKDLDESVPVDLPVHDVHDDTEREDSSSPKDRSKVNRETEDEKNQKREPPDTAESNVTEVDESILAKVSEIGITQRRRASDETNGSDSGVDVVCPDGEEDELLREHMDVWKEQSLSTFGNRTMVPRNLSTDHSLESCLTAFTDEELLTGKNQFGCDHCTEAYGKPNKDGSKQRVHNDAKMQLLILIPPAVLTFHLKRFMQDGMRLRKNGVRVSFPKILDLAPYCSKACINLPSIQPDQTSILYSLYGIVEHSGGLHGGHYTAFVKVRPNTGLGCKFLQPLPLKMGLDDLIREMHRRCEQAERTLSTAHESDTPDRAEAENEQASAYPQPPSVLQNGTADSKAAAQKDAVRETGKTKVCISEGRWYHISDSSVHETSETSALNAEAYLLFYERLT